MTQQTQRTDFCLRQVVTVLRTC